MAALDTQRRCDGGPMNQSQDFWTPDGRLRVSVGIGDEDDSFFVEVFAASVGGKLHVTGQGHSPTHHYLSGKVIFDD